MGICCMCGNPSKELVDRKNGDAFCKKCHEKNCEHINVETLPVANGLDTITICHDCGTEL